MTQIPRCRLPISVSLSLSLWILENYSVLTSNLHEGSEVYFAPVESVLPAETADVVEPAKLALNYVSLVN